MALMRARFLQSLLITIHGASVVSVWKNIASLAAVYSSHLSSDALSMGESFHCLSGCTSRSLKRRRFKERRSHPLKQWKLSPIDMASLDKWDEYTRAKEAMFFHTDTADSPWTVIKSDCKKRARLNAMRYVLHRAAYASKDLEAIGPIDPLLVGRANVVYERGERRADVPG